MTAATEPALPTVDHIAVSPLLPRAPAAPLQVLTPDGVLSEQAGGLRPDLDATRMLYRDMYLGRRLDQQALNLQRQGELGLWLQSAGQEAAQVGSIRGIRDSDYVFPSYREHVSALCRGISPGELLAQWRGIVHAGWSWDDSRFHFYSLVLGTQALHATGYAIGLRSEPAEVDDIVLVYVGDGATSQGDVNEALNWAAVHDAPVIFFCQNNHWAISTPTRLQYRGALHRRANGFGLRSYLVDGNDVLAVQAVVRDAADYVRAGGGPVFVEAETYRMAGHSTSDDPRRYRDDYSVGLWETRDPLHRVERFLRAHDTADDYFGRLEAEGDELAGRAREACKQLQPPRLEDLFDNVYADPHPLMTRQREDWLSFRESLEDPR